MDSLSPAAPVISFLIFPYYCWLIIAWKASAKIEAAGDEKAPRLSRGYRTFFFVGPILFLGVCAMPATLGPGLDAGRAFLASGCSLGFPMLFWMLFLFVSLQDANNYRLKTNPYLRANLFFLIGVVEFLALFVLFKSILGRYAAGVYA